jgi:hypothetical protein
MPSPDLIAPERLEEILSGAFPETEREARVQGLALELRSSTSPAPEALRQRVRTLGATPRKRRSFSRRRLALVLASVCFVAFIGVLAVSGERSGEDESGGQAVPGAAAPQAEGDRTPELVQGASGDVQGALTPVSGRARDIDMWIELRMQNADRLSDAANEATRITRELGGFVAASTVRSAGQEGRAELALRVPVNKVDDATFRLSQLGTITGQRVVTEDLQAGLDRSSRQIAALDHAIRIAELRLKSGTLDAEERLRVEIRLEQLRDQVAELRRSRARLAAQAATAELTLVLHTREAAGAKEESRIGGAAGHAIDFLGRAGSITVFLAIVLSPLVLLLALVWLTLRARARRVEADLLERRRPAAPSPQPRN